MRDSEGGGLTYAVVTEELVLASRAVLAVTETAKAAAIASLPTRMGEVGDGELQQAFADFCARWDRGLSRLVGDSETMSQRLGACADSYVREQESAVAGFRQPLRSCALPAAPPPTTIRLPGPPAFPGAGS